MYNEQSPLRPFFEQQSADLQMLITMILEYYFYDGMNIKDAIYHCTNDVNDQELLLSEMSKYY